MRAPEFRSVQGEVIPLTSLTVPRASDLALLIESGVTPNARVVECRRRASGSEVVIVELNPTVPQRPVVAIARLERVSVAFSQEDSWYPEVCALRKDFPRDRVLHLNGGVPSGDAPSLCLFAEPWPDVRLRLTANELLFRLQNWFDDSASGKLHREDQPLEPAYLSFPVPLIVSPRLIDDICAKPTSLQLDIVQTSTGPVFIQHRPNRRRTNQAKTALAIPFVSLPHEHSLVNDAPQTLHELDEQLLPAGVNLVRDLQERLFAKKDELDRYGFLVLLILLQRKRGPTTEPESELIAFFCTPPPAAQDGISAILRDVGFSSSSFDKNRTGQTTAVSYLRVRFELTPAAAALYSGVEAFEKPLVAVGAGALGSQVVMNAVREGISIWTSIDDDNLLPHNLVRHSLPGDWLGCPKVVGVQEEANSLLDMPTVSHINANVLSPGDRAHEVQKAFESASAIVDLSASVAVTRHLTRDVNARARRCTVFVSSSGRDLIFLGEDEDRAIPLDIIEAQYYRAAASMDVLQGHLEDGSTVGSCRDITTQIPQSLMAIHAAQAVRLIRSWLAGKEAMATVLRAEPNGFGFNQVTIPIGKLVVVGQLGTWALFADSQLLETVVTQRKESLPNETGGVLLAHVDVQRRTLYVTHQIPAPPDSERQPTVYIRGSKGLFEEYGRIRRATRENLAYIGEWHSHPDSCACEPSLDDIEAGAWLAEQARPTSLPGVMLIAGEQRQTCWMLCSRTSEDGAPIHLCLKWGEAA